MAQGYVVESAGTSYISASGDGAFAHGYAFDNILEVIEFIIMPFEFFILMFLSKYIKNNLYVKKKWYFNLYE